MRRVITFMRRVITLTVCGFLLSVSQAALAVIVFDSAVVDETNSKIVVKGTGLDTIVGTVFLGGVDITADIMLTPTEMTADFSTATAAAVPEKGSYLLRASDVTIEYTFSIYFDAPIIAPPPPGGCPCVNMWNSYGSISSPNGFGNLSPHCQYESADGSQSVVQFYTNKKGGLLWVLYSEHGSTSAGSYPDTCGLAIDEDPIPVDALEHAACVTELQAIGVGAPACTVSDPLLFPPLLPGGY